MNLDEQQANPGRVSPDLKGSVAIVNGGASRLGFCIVSRLCQAGASVMIADPSADAVEQLAADFQSTGEQVMHVVTDVRYISQIESAVAYTVNEFGRIDLLINISSCIGSGGFFDLTLENWNSVLDLDLKGVVFFTQAVAKQMLMQGTGGRIMNVLPETNLGGFIPHIAVRSGLCELSRQLSRELEPLGIAADCIQPGAGQSSIEAGESEMATRLISKLTAG